MIFLYGNQSHEDVLFEFSIGQNEYKLYCPGFNYCKNRIVDFIKYAEGLNPFHQNDSKVLQALLLTGQSFALHNCIFEQTYVYQTQITPLVISMSERSNIFDIVSKNKLGTYTTQYAYHEELTSKHIYVINQSGIVTKLLKQEIY